ncbi:MAG TPA: hypothetical protein VNW99_01350 [Cytophagaceae bacterium]|jgi:hypothetical protein|nr:hypothetical protein [Cytophagaceae bacterium]
MSDDFNFSRPQSIFAADVRRDMNEISHGLTQVISAFFGIFYLENRILNSLIVYLN